MAKIKVKSLAELEKVIKGKIHDGLFFSSNLQDSVAETMQENIENNVYGAFTPTEYERRGDKGGFSDMANMRFTDVDVQNSGVLFKFENMTEGNDSMSGEQLTEMFETGDKSSWDNPYAKDSQDRVVSDARPFIQSTIDDLNSNKGELHNSLRKDLRNLGFKIS